MFYIKYISIRGVIFIDNKIFKPKIEKSINNNRSVFYSSFDNDLVKNDDETPIEVLNRLIKSGSYIFNYDVLIKTNSNEYRTRIAGKVNDNIITMDNVTIPISSIVSIKVI